MRILYGKAPSLPLIGVTNRALGHVNQMVQNHVGDNLQRDFEATNLREYINISK
jgi:hypothetical protein